MNDWRSIKDHLPPFHRKVLIYFNEEISTGWRESTPEETLSIYCPGYGWPEEIESWMPLPEGPTGDYGPFPGGLSEKIQPHMWRSTKAHMPELNQLTLAVDKLYGPMVAFRDDEGIWRQYGSCAALTEISHFIQFEMP